MGLSTVPWPPSNDPGVRDIVKLGNVAYVVALPFIVAGAIGLIRRRWSSGGGGELVMLVQLSTVLVTAVVYFGDPRYRTPYDVFGVALLGAVIADRLFDRSLQDAARYPDVSRDDAVEEDAESRLWRAEPARQIDAYEPSPAEADGAPAVGAQHDPT
jgi:hypothetical protein